MRSRRSVSFWMLCVLYSIIVHAIVLGVYFLKFEQFSQITQPTKIGGFEGKIDQDLGITQDQQDPIQVNIVGSDQPDARQIIAQRIAKMAQQQAQQPNAQPSDQAVPPEQQADEQTAEQETPTVEQPTPAVEQPTPEQAKPDNTKAKESNLQVTKGPALVKNKEALEKVEPKDAKKVTDTKSTKVDQKLAKTEDKDQHKTPTNKQTADHPVTPAAKPVPTPTPTPAPTTAHNDKKTTATKPAPSGDDTEQILSDLAKESAKSTKTNAKTTKAQQAALTKQTGHGGGDGADTTDISDDVARYRQRIQAQVLRNFEFNEFAEHTQCRIGVEISRDGHLLNPTIILGTAGTDACKYGMRAIQRTKRVSAPSDAIFSEVHNTSFFFGIN